MTATLGCVTTPSRPSVGVPLDERSAVASRRGIPWWAAVLLAFLATAVGIGIDLGRGDSLTTVFLVFYAAGCVLAVLAVMRRGLFAAMVQPPLILALSVPLVVKLLGHGSAGGLRNQVLALALPLVNGFPTMAVTTVVTVALGGARLLVTRPARAPRPRRRPLPGNADEVLAPPAHSTSRPHRISPR